MLHAASKFPTRLILSVARHKMLLWGFLMATMLLIQSVGLFTFAIIFCSIYSSTFFIISFFIATGIFRGTCCADVMLLSTSRCSYPGKQPSVSKSPYFSNIFFLESRSPFVFLFVIFCMYLVIYLFIVYIPGD